MKRKALREFADYLERSRGPFTILDNQKCIAAYARKWAKQPQQAWEAGWAILMYQFGLSGGVAIDLYVGQDTKRLLLDDGQWKRITRKVAVATLRRLARTGKVEFRT